MILSVYEEFFYKMIRFSKILTLPNILKLKCSFPAKRMSIYCYFG